MNQEMTPDQALLAAARRMANIIRQVEAVSPGYFGEAAAVIRQFAAGDDVALVDLLRAVASARSTMAQAINLFDNPDHYDAGRND